MRRALAGALAVALTSGVLVGAAAPASAKAASCSTTPFTGELSRTEDDFSNQPAAERAGEAMTDAIVYDFGTGESYTIYLADYALDSDELGTTLVAPEGNVLVTIFLARKNTKTLKRGQKLKVSRDFVTVIIDAGGVAQASSDEQEGSAKIVKISDDRVCFTIDYQDAHQSLDGSVSAQIP